MASLPTRSATGIGWRSTRRSASSACRSSGRSRSTPEGSRSPAARSAWPRSSRRSSSPPTACRPMPRARPSCWPAGTGARRRSTPRWWRTDACRHARGSAASSPRRRMPAGRWAWPRPRQSHRSAPSSSRLPDPTARPGLPFLAGDVVERKKPAPDIYLLAIERLGIAAGRDARHRGLAQRAPRRGRGGAALRGHRQRLHRGGGLREAVLVVSSLGDPGGERTRVIANRSEARPGEFITLPDLERCLAG